MDIALIVVLVVGVATLLGRIAVLESNFGKFRRLEMKLDLLLKQAGIAYDDFANVSPAVRAELERGNTIAAIKQQRLASGMGLREAKDFVEELRKRLQLPG